MKDVKVIPDDLVEIFGNEIEFVENSTGTNNIAGIPKTLQSFYSKYLSARMPFGTIYALEQAQEISSQKPFVEDGWFCFGQDNYGFVFWLCKDAEEGEPCFVAWDHEMNVEIDEAYANTLEEFIQTILNEFEEQETCSVIIERCDENALSELVKIKKIFHLSLSMAELKEIPSNLPYEISGDFLYMEALELVKELKLNKVKIQIFQY